MNGHPPALDPKTPPSDPDNPPSGATRRRRILIVVLVLAGLLLLVALVPRLLSLGPFRHMALRAVNKRMNGTVEMKSWSLRWVSGFRFRDVRVTDEQGETLLEADTVNLRTTVFGLLGKTKNLRVIEVLSPKANLVFNEDGTNNFDPLLSSFEGGTSDIRGRMLVQGGTVNVSLLAYDARFALTDAGLNLGIKGLNEPLDVQLTGALGDKSARVIVQGTVSMPQETASRGSVPEATFNVMLKGLDVAHVSQLAQRFGASVQASGKADVDMDAMLSGSGDLQASGRVSLESFGLTGESRWLSDRPVLPFAVMSFDVTRTGSDVHISDLQIGSPLLAGRVKGKIALSPEGLGPVSDLAINGSIDLQEVAREFSKALALRQGLRVERGMLAFDVDVNSEGKAGAANVSVHMKDLAATLDGRSIRLDVPVELTAEASVDPEGRIKLSMLNLTSSFINAEGHGDQTAFEVTLTSDLEAAMAEVSKFADVGDKTLSGKAEMVMRASYKDADEPRVSASLELDRIKMNGFLKKPVEMPDAGFSFDGILVPGRAGDPIQVQDIAGRFHLSMGGAEFSIESLTARGRGLPTVTGGQINGKLNAGDAVASLRYMERLKAQVYAQGEVEYACQFASAGDVVKLEKLHAVIDPLKIAGEDIPTIEDDRLVLDAGITLQPGIGSVEISHFDLVSGPAKLKGSGSLSGNAEARVFQAKGEMKLDFNRIGPLLAAVFEQPIQTHGGAFRPFRVRAALGGANWRETLGGTTATVGTYLSSAAFADVETGPVEIGAILGKGKSALKIDALVAGVKVNMPLVIDIMDDPMRVTMPSDTAILADARLSTDLADRFVKGGTSLQGVCRNRRERGFHMPRIQCRTQ